MGKCMAFTAVGVVSLLIGAVCAGVAVFFLTQPQSNNMPMKGMCQLDASEGNNVFGTIHFEQMSSTDELHITGNVTGLTTGQHGFHIHTLGSYDGKCKMAAGHYNPYNEPHGAPSSDNRHIGDLGNILSEGANTQTLIEIMDSMASLYGEYSIYGRSIVIHEGADDLGPQSATGNAGGRVACCTIFHS